MFYPKMVLINAFVERVQAAYRLTYGQLEPDYPGILKWAGRMAWDASPAVTPSIMMSNIP
jgi:hypothetical protein